jgi:UDP-N-acetyl-D-glucosamine dehydrogenase
MPANPSHNPATSLMSLILRREARVAVIGLGYVGLPLAMSLAKAGFRVLGFDIDPPKIAALHRGESYIDAVGTTELHAALEAGRFAASSDLARLGECDVIAICVPTPLDAHREPDLRFVETTTRDIARSLRPGQLIILESTTWPGTTKSILRPILEAGGLRSGQDFFLGFSPEREDPGNRDFTTAVIPKVVAGDEPAAQGLIAAFYGAAFAQVVPVSSTATAEAVKITENIFRAVNIALVNELKIVYEAMGIDIWEVIEAAKTKPFGYMPFYPGPGLGGHCIPIDPFYLTWKSREYEQPTRFIELAGEINSAMPRHVTTRLAEALDRISGKALSRARVLILGLAYKKNVPDLRESPALKLIELIEARGAEVSYHDPHLAEIPPTRAYGGLKGRCSQPLSAETLAQVDAVLIATDHDAVDYALVARAAALIIDTRNVMARNGFAGAHIVKA